jgi:16S rRNA (guanine(527)-N(7))-methyltransferase RsmG
VLHLELVEKELQALQIKLPTVQKLALASYCDELHHWNQKINLTALVGADLVRRLAVEPVWIGRQLGLAGSLLDIGSGSGCPAIPLRIVCPLRSCDLVEARSKRAAFLRHVVATLNLQNTVVHRARFEDALKGLPKPDWVTLQAVALTHSLVRSIRAIASQTTTIVWVTSSASPVVGLRSLTRFAGPFTGTDVLLFQLDLS